MSINSVSLLGSIFMKKILLVLFILLFHLSVNTPRPIHNIRVSPELKDDFELYLSYAQLYGVKISNAIGEIEVTKLPLKQLGLCSYYSFDYTSGNTESTYLINVYINPKMLADKTDLGRKNLREVVFHELAHCLSSVGHVNSQLSIMSPVMDTEYIPHAYLLHQAMWIALHQQFAFSMFIDQTPYLNYTPGLPQGNPKH
jgi:hypothetical protein